MTANPYEPVAMPVKKPKWPKRALNTLGTILVWTPLIIMGLVCLAGVRDTYSNYGMVGVIAGAAMLFAAAALFLGMITLGLCLFEKAKRWEDD